MEYVELHFVQVMVLVLVQKEYNFDLMQIITEEHIMQLRFKRLLSQHSMGSKMTELYRSNKKQLSKEYERHFWS